MHDPSRLNRRLVLGAAGAFSVLGGLLATVSRAGSTAKDKSAARGPAPAAVQTEFVLKAHVTIAPAVTIGPSSQGLRRLVPITGGSFEGPRVRGEVVPGGADYQVVRPDGVTSIEAKYTLRTSDGALIYIANRGISVRPGEHGPNGEESYVRTVPEFEAPIGPHDWLNKSIFVGTLDGSQFAAGYVVIRIYRVI